MIMEKIKSFHNFLIYTDISIIQLSRDAFSRGCYGGRGELYLICTQGCAWVGCIWAVRLFRAAALRKGCFDKVALLTYSFG